MAALNDRANKILSVLFDYEEISEETLRLIYGKKKYSKNIINKLLDKKLIKRGVLKIKASKKAKYEATSIHLSSLGQKELFRYGVDSADCRRKRVGGSKWIERIMKTSDSVLTCCVAGCVGYKKAGYPHEMCLLEDVEHPFLNINPFMDQVQNMDVELLISLIRKYGVIFSMTDIRRDLKYLTQDGNHWNSSSATGLLLAENGPYMVYHANHGYLAMARSGELNFSIKLMTYLNAQGIYSDRYGMMDGVRKAIIFVRDKVSVRRLVQNTYLLNYKAFQEFNESYIIPISQEGVQYLKLIMHHSDFRQSLLDVLLQKHNCVANTNLFEGYKYPVVSEDGIRIFYGIEMDLLLLHEVYKEGLEIYILCLEWQVEYYKSIFGEKVSFITITQKSIEKILLNKNLAQE